jgi:sialate O-acetylesterase
MVLQQGKQVSIWGWAEPGEKVAVSGSWQIGSWDTTADKDGKWMIKIEPPKAGGPYRMTIAGKNVITIDNIMSGEVWVCSGQSNMQWPVKLANNAEEEIAAADYPKIRLFSVPQVVAEEPQDDCKGEWTACSPESVENFSAVAYYFGRMLHQELDVPIGLIHTSWGGTPAESWTSRPALEAEPALRHIPGRWDEAMAKYVQDLEEKLAEWREAVQKAKKSKDTPKAPRWPRLPTPSWRPSGLYNAMIAPLAPYAIQGTIWYQGESNVEWGYPGVSKAERAYEYRTLFPAMIEDWRRSWGQGDFPFLFVQLANYMRRTPEPQTDSAWAALREAQLMTLSLPNTGMAVIIDIGEANDIHPKNKQDVGKRLALWALAKTYGKKLVHSGPIYKSMEKDGKRIMVKFKHTGSGLIAKGEEELKGFAVAGVDRKFYWAEAEIEADTVLVWSDKVPKPVAVRYAWASNPRCNLYNREGLPASPFRTDDWPGITANEK